MKKRMYYNMRIKTIQRNASNLIKIIQIGKKLKTFKLDIEITRLTKKMYMASRELEERTLLPLKTDNSDLHYKSNPLDLLDHEKLINDLERK